MTREQEKITKRRDSPQLLWFRDVIEHNQTRLNFITAPQLQELTELRGAAVADHSTPTSATELTAITKRTARVSPEGAPSRFAFPWFL